MTLSSRLSLSVFITGSSIMIVELVGSRILAPTLGTSTLVWTSLIGLILGALSLGYWWGGNLADKKPDVNIFALLLLASAVLIWLIPFVAPLTLTLLQTLSSSIAFRAVVVTIIVFCPAAVLLGMSSPYAARLLLHSVADSGKTVGRLYALSTLGSIVGTFFAGFVLLTYFRTSSIIFGVAALLALTSLLTVTSKTLTRIIVIFGSITVLSVIGLNEPVFAQGTIVVPTRYQDVRIFPAIDPKTNRDILVWQTDPLVWQSAIYPDAPNEPVFNYLKGYDLYKAYLDRKPERALLLGGAGYVYPRHFLQHEEHAQMDIVEIDGELAQIAKDHFMLEDHPRMHLFTGDARTFLAQSGHTYDVIFGDAYTAVYSIPYHLTTVEALHEVKQHLANDGVFIVNVITALEGEKAAFLQHFVHTLEQVFTHVDIRQTDPEKGPETVQNILIFAHNHPNENLNSTQNDTLFPLYKVTTPVGTKLLTDQYAPVEALTRTFFR